jgi:hypothetical protein
MAKAYSVYTYKSERAFHNAMRRFGWRVIRWYGTDHAWIIEARNVS